MSITSNRNDIIYQSPTGEGEEQEKNGFDKLMATLYSFLNATARKDGVGTSKITSYVYKDDSTSTDPHTITDGKSQDKNSKIIEDFSAPLNVIKDIIDNNYMKLNNITISNDYYPLNSHKKIPALTDYQALAEYWKDGKAAACNGACVGYCSGSCAGATKHGTSGSNIDDTKGWGCSSCTSECSINCSGTCHSQNGNVNLKPHENCGSGCASHCLNGCFGYCVDLCTGCHSDCQNKCGLNCYARCSSSCGGCYTDCTGNCIGDCNSCSSKCGSGCEGECGGTCQNKCGSTCGGTCMFGSSAKPIKGGKNS